MLSKSAGVAGTPFGEWVNLSSIAHPEYMPKGEVRLEDSDGYVLLIGQSG